MVEGMNRSFSSQTLLTVHWDEKILLQDDRPRRQACQPCHWSRSGETFGNAQVVCQNRWSSCHHSLWAIERLLCAIKALWCTLIQLCPIPVAIKGLYVIGKDQMISAFCQMLSPCAGTCHQEGLLCVHGAFCRVWNQDLWPVQGALVIHPPDRNLPVTLIPKQMSIQALTWILERKFPRDDNEELA